MGANKIASRILGKKLKVHDENEIEEEVINLSSSRLSSKDKSPVEKNDEISETEETRKSKIHIDKDYKETIPLVEKSKDEIEKHKVLIDKEINEGGNEKMEEKDKKVNNEILIEDDEFLTIDTPLPKPERMKTGDNEEEDNVNGLELDDIFLDYHNDNVEDEGFQFEKPLREEPLSEEPLSEEPLSEEPLFEEPLKEEISLAVDNPEIIEEPEDNNKYNIEFELDDNDDILNVNNEDSEQEITKEGTLQEEPEIDIVQEEPKTEEPETHNSAFGFSKLITNRFRHNQEPQEDIAEEKKKEEPVVGEIEKPQIEDAEEEFEFEDIDVEEDSQHESVEEKSSDEETQEEEEKLEFEFEDIHNDENLQEELIQEEKEEEPVVEEKIKLQIEDEEEFEFEDIEEIPQIQIEEKDESNSEDMKTEEIPQGKPVQEEKEELLVEQAVELESEEEFEFEDIDIDENPQEEPIKEEKEEPEILEENSVENPSKEEHDYSENEKLINELIADYSLLQGMSSGLREFLLHNINWVTKERIGICLDNGSISLVDYKDFLLKKIDGPRKMEVYDKIRELEMQYLFEDIDLEFDLEGLIREKTTIDGKVLKNIGKLKNSVEVDVFDTEGEINQLTIQEGEYAFILSDKLELNLQNYIEEIKTAKLNCDEVLVIVLKGSIVDPQVVIDAQKLGIKIVQMGISISRINKDLEKLMNKIIA